MKNNAIFYSPSQMEIVKNHIEKMFYNECQYVAHEITSEFVHSDVLFIPRESGGLVLSTLGKVARLINKKQS